MKDKKNKISISLILPPIFMLIYAITVFSIAGFSGHNSVFWVSFVFECISFLFVEMIFIFFRSRLNEACDWIFRIPLYKHSAIYFGVEFIISTIFICISKKIPFALAMIPQVIVLVVFSVFAFSSFAYKEKVESVRTNVIDNTKFIKNVTLQMEILSKHGSSEKIKSSYGELYKKYIYSDPVSIAETENLETEILQLLETAKNANEDTAIALSKDISRLFDERNHKCKACKIY